MLIPPMHSDRSATSLPSSGRGDSIFVLGSGRLKNSRQASALMARFMVLSDLGIVTLSQGLNFIRITPRSSSFSSTIAFLKICRTQVGYISLARFVFDRLSIQRFIAEDDKLLNRSRVVPMKRSKWFTASL